MTSPTPRWSGAWRFLERLSTVAVLGAASVFVYTSIVPQVPPPPPPIPVPPEPVQLISDSSAGNPEATVGMLVFSDFQCPFCATFATSTWPTLRREYVDTGRVVAAFRHLPLEKIHPQAFMAAQVAVCAGRQARFWEVHDLLFAGFVANPRQRVSADAGSTRNAIGGAGVNLEQFDRCLESEAGPVVRADIADATRLGVRSTPATFVGALMRGGRLRVLETLKGALPVEEFRKALDRALTVTTGPDAGRNSPEPSVS